MKYYYCQNCLDIKTEKEILNDCSNGGTGLCDCNFMTFEWSEKYKKFEPVYLRLYYTYFEITKKLYLALKEINQIDRLLHLRHILPEKEFIVNQ